MKPKFICAVDIARPHTPRHIGAALLNIHTQIIEKYGPSKEYKIKQEDNGQHTTLTAREV